MQVTISSPKEKISPHVSTFNHYDVSSDYRVDAPFLSCLAVFSLVEGPSLRRSWRGNILTDCRGIPPASSRRFDWAVWSRRPRGSPVLRRSLAQSHTELCSTAQLQTVKTWDGGVTPGKDLTFAFNKISTWWSCIWLSGRKWFRELVLAIKVMNSVWRKILLKLKMKFPIYFFKLNRCVL